MRRAGDEEAAVEADLLVLRVVAVPLVVAEEGSLPVVPTFRPASHSDRRLLPVRPQRPTLFSTPTLMRGPLPVLAVCAEVDADSGRSEERRVGKECPV